MPPTPRSPRPSTRSPSVTTTTSMSRVTDDVVEQLVDPIAQRPRQVEPTFASEVDRPALTCQADGRGVDDRQQIGEVPFEERVEQHRVAVLQRPQEHVAFHVGRLVGVLRLDPRQLRVEVLVHGRQQSVEPEPQPLLGRERGPLVRVPIGEERTTVRHAVTVSPLARTGPRTLCQPQRATSMLWLTQTSGPDATAVCVSDNARSRRCS